MKKIIGLILAILLICSAVQLPVSAVSGTIADGDVMKYADMKLLSKHMVYYPAQLEESDGKWPVIVWANGTDCIPALYTGLFEGLAKNGYVVVVSTEVMAADGKDQCDSIDYIFSLNNNSKSQFYQKIDTSKVAAVGHSQGGRSSVNAAQRDERIKCVVSIAGSNVNGEADGLKTPVFFITGTADLVVLSSLWVKPAYNAVEGPAVYASLKDAIHTTCMTAPAKILGYTVKWLDANLKDDEAAMEVFKDGGELSVDTGWTDYESKNLSSTDLVGTKIPSSAPGFIEIIREVVLRLINIFNIFSISFPAIPYC